VSTASTSGAQERRDLATRAAQVVIAGHSGCTGGDRWRMQEDLELVREQGRGNVNVTVGSALDIFGGDLPYQDVLQWHRTQQAA
jgi:hypothetical protein